MVSIPLSLRSLNSIKICSHQIFYSSVCFAFVDIVLYPNKSLHLFFPSPVSKLNTYFPGLLIHSHETLPLVSRGMGVASVEYSVLKLPI